MKLNKTCECRNELFNKDREIKMFKWIYADQNLKGKQTFLYRNRVFDVKWKRAFLNNRLSNVKWKRAFLNNRLSYINMEMGFPMKQASYINMGTGLPTKQDLLYKYGTGFSYETYFLI